MSIAFPLIFVPELGPIDQATTSLTDLEKAFRIIIVANCCLFCHVPVLFHCPFLRELFLTISICRVAVTRARNLFFKAYYDPFNPELHLYIFKSDNSLHLPRLDSSSTSWPRTLLSYGRSSLFDFVNIPSYMAQLWPMDEQNKVWPPT